MPDKVAAHSRTVSLFLPFPHTFQVSHIALSSREKTKSSEFRQLFDPPDLTKALRETSGGLLETPPETRPDPDTSPRRDSLLYHHKSTHPGHPDWHVGDTKPPQPPPYVEPSFLPASSTISFLKPQLAGPQGRRIARACGHMRRPWKRHRNPTSPSLQT